MSTETDTRTHKVAKDDTLRSLALRYYGNAEKWPVIQRANKLQSEDIFVGEELIIPDVTLPPPAPAPEHRFVPMSPRERAAGHSDPESRRALEGDGLGDRHARSLRSPATSSSSTDLRGHERSQY